MNLASLNLQRRIAILRWTLPVLLGGLTVFYEISPGRRIHDAISADLYFDVDIVFYGTVMPLIVFALLTWLRHWFEKTAHTEQQARVSERRLGAIMASSADAILSLDAEGQIESWNRGAELLFGYTADQVRGRSLASLLNGAEAADTESRWLRQTVQEAEFVRGHETACRTVTGHVVAVELTATRLTDESNRYLGMSIVLRDVTERKHRDEEIRRLNTSLSEQVSERTRELNEKVQQLAQANARLRMLDQMRSEFVSLVSHQIRAPLTNMRGASERMRTNCAEMNATCNRMFVILDQQVARLDRLVQGVLNAAHIEAGELALELEPISVLPIVQQVVEQTHARIIDRPIHVPTKPGLPLVLADRDRVSEVLANLLDNADKYSPPGREITIDVQADQVEVTLSVRDYGHGLKPGDEERLFDKFYRADSSDSQMAYGYGLGLYVCRRLVEAQGGRIWAGNAAGGGAVFSFTLPMARP